MQRLSAATVSSLRARGAEIPEYDRNDVTVGVAHFGPGAFHRVHQAYYFDRALRHDPRWGICEIALRTPDVRNALAPQDGLYTLAVLDAQSSLRIIGAAKEFLVASDAARLVVERLTDPAIRLVTATITEKGYCLDAQGALDFNHPDVLRDLSVPHAPQSFVGVLAASLRQRRERQIAPPVILSCDNLTDNGHRLRGAVIEYARRLNADDARWIDSEVSFPRTMVDSITPATDQPLRDRVAGTLQVEDAWPVQRESFCQWVIEADFRGETPDWSSIGVTVTADLRGYEQAKLRLLNGAHSSLAYLGLLAGFSKVSEAINDASLGRFIAELMRADIAPFVAAPAGLDVDSYISALLRRFSNPALVHRLEQIAWDGSQKIPFRLLGTIRDRLAVHVDVRPLALPIAAWFLFIRRKQRSGAPLTDPLSGPLLSVAESCTGNPMVDTQRFLAVEQVFPTALARNKEFSDAVSYAYGRLVDVQSAEDLRHALEF